MIRGRAVLAALCCEAALGFGLAKLVGTPVTWSALLALPVSGLVLLALCTPRAIEPSWQPLPAGESAVTFLEASTLATRLADAAADQSRFSSRIQPRLARLAIAWLRQRPGTEDLTDLRDPRAAPALGTELHALLTDPSATLPEPRTVARLLARLEES